MAVVAVDELWQLLVLRAVAGVGEAALFVGAATLIADLAPPDRRAEAASYFSVAVFGGLGIGPIVGDLVLADDRYGRAFVVAGGFAWLAALVALAVPRDVSLPAPVEALGELPVRSGFDRIMHPAAVGPGLVLACGIAGFAVFTAFLPDHARDVGLAGSGCAVRRLQRRVPGAALRRRPVAGTARRPPCRLDRLHIAGPGARPDGAVARAVGAVDRRRASSASPPRSCTRR